jgi:hypothetical protein
MILAKICFRFEKEYICIVTTINDRPSIFNDTFLQSMQESIYSKTFCQLHHHTIIMENTQLSTLI